MKKVSVIFLSFLLLFLNSCSSIADYIPGKKEMDIKNIYIEYYNIAETYFSLEKYDKAATYYEASFPEKSTYYQAYYGLAKCYVYLSRWNDAADLYKKLLERDPDNASLKASLAYIYANNSQVELACQMYDQLISEFPYESVYLENLIAVKLLNDDIGEIGVLMTALENDFPESTKIETFRKEFDKITNSQ